MKRTSSISRQKLDTALTTQIQSRAYSKEELDNILKKIETDSAIESNYFSGSKPHNKQSDQEDVVMIIKNTSQDRNRASRYLVEKNSSLNGLNQHDNVSSSRVTLSQLRQLNSEL